MNSFLKVFLFASLIGSLFALNSCDFDCNSGCLVVVSKQDLGNGFGLVTVSAESCKHSAVSWIACMNTNCYAYSCNGVLTGSTSSNKCDEITYASYMIPISTSGVVFQMHDGQQAGNLVCTKGGNSNCAGGGGSGCSVDGINNVETGVCVIDFINEFWDSEDFTEPECTSDAGCHALDLCNVAYCGTDGKCHQGIAGNTKLCRASAGFCDLPEYCDGQNAACPTNAFKESTVVCREALTFVNEISCDQAEYCTGNSAACPEDLYIANLVCRAKDGDCDTEEKCSGTSPRCPDDQVEPVTTMCRAQVVDPIDHTSCDIADYCDGVNKACTEDKVKDDTFVCRASVGVCDKPETCTGSSNACPADAKEPTTKVCREAKVTTDSTAITCDTPEYCNGGNDCPADKFLGWETVCRSQNGVCDKEERCTSISPDCPADAVEPATTMCRAKVVNPDDGTSCDIADYCDGTNKACTEDKFETSDVVCRASAGVCDKVENCPGNSNACPVDAKEPSTTVCRAAELGTDGTTCDKTEYCTGSANDCPADEILPSGTVCRANADLCDVPETCKGTKVCPSDIRKDHGYVYKCGTTAFLCGVKSTELSLNGNAYTLGGCGIGSVYTFVDLAWPQCVDQCVDSLCPNNKGLSNNEVYNCNVETGSWYCVWKWEGSDVATGTCPNEKFGLTSQWYP